MCVCEREYVCVCVCVYVCVPVTDIGMQHRQTNDTMMFPLL